MKTLILNGSPRIDGDTMSLIDVLKTGISDEVKVVSAYRCNVSPCVDCRYCWENTGCAIQDEMQEIYRYIEECDNIIPLVSFCGTNEKAAVCEEKCMKGLRR